ncbi:hypothetical protein ACSBR2_043114 [Camellia fascicularis]
MEISGQSEVPAEKFHYNEEDESEYEECDSDDSDEDPTFEVVDKIRCRFSRLSTKNKPKSRNIKEMEEGNEEDPDVVVELVVPELGEEDQKSFEAVQKIIDVGQVEKLKVDQCKVYLRKHGLRLTGNKDILIERIKEHLDILSGGGEKKYQISSFVLNCKGDACTGDVVMFEQNVYEMFNIASRSASGPPCGKRIVAGRIVKESYGAAKQQHTFTIEVLWSEGEKPLPPLYPLLIKGRNLYRLKTMRQRWENEGERQKMISEKHARGSLARSNREARIQLKEMKKGKTSVPIVNVPSQRIQQCQHLTSMPSRSLLQSQNHEPIMKSIPSHCQFQRQSHEQYTNGNNPLRWPLTNMNCSIQSKDPYPFGSCPGSMSPLRSHNHERSMISYPLRNPIQRQGPERSMNPNSSRHANKGNMNLSPTKGPFQRQLCQFYAQERCHYGDRCKYLHEYRGNQNYGERMDERWPFDLRYY